MKIKKSYRNGFALFVICATFLLGCNPLATFSGSMPILQLAEREGPTTIETKPEFARDAVLEYLRIHYNIPTPTSWISWTDETNEAYGKLVSFKYIADGWSVNVSQTPEITEASITAVEVNTEVHGIQWLGLVDAFGQVVETSFTTGVGSGENTNEPEPTEAPADTPTPTATPIPPTQTQLPPTPTPRPPTPTPVPVPCNAAIFQADLTILDGTKFAPGVRFKKTWRLKNIGACTWTTGYDLVFVEGARMDGKKAIALPETIRPGEALDISVNLTSPDKPGKYRGYWMFRSQDGQWFGIGSAANQAFWVEIKVLESRTDYAYDFALNFCAATWRSGDMRLPCPGYSTSREGFTVLLDSPRLENRHEDELAIWIHPNEEKGGWIEGSYPTIKIQSGDHFISGVGCLEDNKRCDLTFYLDYEDEDGIVSHLGKWTEVYDGEITTIDIDLSDLVGQSASFILGVEANTNKVGDAHGFWFVPHIEREK